MIYFIGDTNRVENKSSIINIEIEKAIENIKKVDIICEDVETKGLNYLLPNQVRMIQIGTKTDQYLFDVETCNYIKLKEVLEDKKIEKIVANVEFERHMLTSIGIRINTTFDVLIAARVLRQGRNPRNVFTLYGSYYIYSLGGVYKEYLDIDMDKSEQKGFIYGGKYTDKQIKYAAKDVEMFDIANELKKRLIVFKLLTKKYNFGIGVEEALEKDMFSVTYIEQRVALYLADMTYNGIYINFKKMLNLYNKNIKKRTEIERNLNAEVKKLKKFLYSIKDIKEIEDILAEQKIMQKPPLSKEERADLKEKLNIMKNYNEVMKNENLDYNNITVEPLDNTVLVQKSIFGEDTYVLNKNKDKRRINWNSPTKIKYIIFNEAREIVVDKHKNETTTVKELEKDKYKESKILGLFIEYKHIDKLISSYGITYKRFISTITNRVHCSTTNILETGRIALKKPNLAQIPGGEEWRDIFEATEGNKIVGADYGGQESRVMADKSKDSVFLDFFKSGGGDSHSMVASRVYSVKEKREVIVSKYKLSIELKKDDDTDKIIEKVQQLYPKAEKTALEEIKNKVFASVFSEIEPKENRPPNPLRQKGKTLNFFISFGGSAYTLKSSQGISMKEASSLLNGFWSGFPELKDYFNKEKVEALKHGYILVNNVSKRRRWLPEWKEYRGYVLKVEKAKKDYIANYGLKEGTTMFYKSLKDKNTETSYYSTKAFIMKSEMERAAMNTGIQGTAADMTKTAEILLMDAIENKGLSLIKEIQNVNHIHDEILLEVENRYANLAAALLTECMEKAANIYCSDLNIQAKSYIADVWKH